MSQFSGLSSSQIGDLIESTRLAIRKNRLIETQEYIDTPLTRLFFGRGVVREGGGRGIETRIRVRDKGTFKFVNLYETDSNIQVDVTAEMQATWRHWQEHAVFDTKETAMNSGQPKLFDTVLARLSSAYETVANRLEEDVAQTAVNVGHTKSLQGLGAMLAPLEAGVTTTTPGFNGKTIIYRDGSTGTTFQGLDASLAKYKRLRNWVDLHDGEMTPILLDKIRRAMNRTKFRRIPQLKGRDPKRSGERIVLMGLGLAEQYESMVQSSIDGASGDGMNARAGALRGVRLIPVPVFDDLLTHNPIYGVWTKHIHGHILRGRWMDERRAKPDSNAMDVVRIQISGSGLMYNDNRRESGWLIHEPIAA